MYALKAVKIEKKNISRPFKEQYFLMYENKRKKGIKNTYLYYTIILWGNKDSKQ